MELKECYDRMGGDYEAVLARLRQDERIRKFLALFPRDTNYQSLTESFAAEDWPTAFRAAHSLKGISLNLGLKKLAESSSELTEALRNGAPGPEGAPLLQQVTEDYEIALSTIQEYLA